MSTVDSQLLVIGGTVVRDLAPESGPAGLRRGRIAVVGTGLAAMAAALLIRESIFNTVLFAWSALGAAFGPLLLVRLFRGPVRPAWSMVAMCVGFAVTVAWYFTPALKSRLYELVPAFAAAGLIAWCGARPARR
jgi:Na+/proline symporter